LPQATTEIQRNEEERVFWVFFYLEVPYLDALEAPFSMSQNVLKPLDAYIPPEFDLANFQDTLIESFKYQN
jgi:hypothetical protein